MPAVAGRKPGRLCALALALAAFAAAAAAVAPARAEALTWVVKGRGFGHGVGMSQYGAYGLATHGRGYKQILRHYYRGTSIGTVKGRVVRVLLEIDSGDVGFTRAVAACGRRLNPSRRYEAHRRGGQVKLRTSGGKRLKSCGDKLRAHGQGKIRIAHVGPYRGALEVVPTRSVAGALNVINAVNVDKYVQGSVPGEVPSSWPAAALKAQAVAARSYALSSGCEDCNGFSLFDDTRSQVYGGIALETAATNRAARTTRGEVVTYGGQIAQTLYFSTSGGRTENSENVFFSTPIPYLRSVRDPYDGASPLHTWTLRYSNASMQSRLGPYVPGRLRKIRVTKRGVSPRIIRAQLVGTGGNTSIRGDTLQYALGLYDRWAYFIKAR